MGYGERVRGTSLRTVSNYWAIGRYQRNDQKSHCVQKALALVEEQEDQECLNFYMSSVLAA